MLVYGLVAAVLVGLGAYFALRPLCASWRQARFDQARRDFHRQRERLEAKFVLLGMAATKPDGPRWIDCQFDDDVAYVRNRSTGELWAFVAVNIELGPSPDSALGDGGSYRAGTAVFRFDRRHWETDGRAIFNLTPSEAIRFYHRDLEMVGQEVVHRW